MEVLTSSSSPRREPPILVKERLAKDTSTTVLPGTTTPLRTFSFLSNFPFLSNRHLYYPCIRTLQNLCVYMNVFYVNVHVCIMQQLLCLFQKCTCFMRVQVYYVQVHLYKNVHHLYSTSQPNPTCSPFAKPCPNSLLLLALFLSTSFSLLPLA